MTLDNLLFVFVAVLLAVTTWLILTNTQTPEGRDAMLRDEEMWP